MSEHCVVFRIEHSSETGPNGLPLGPYARHYTGPNKDVDEVGELLHQTHRFDDPQRPTWDDERWTFQGRSCAIFAVPNRDQLRAGFASGAQLTEWFTTDERELLELAGHVVRKYLVPVADVVTGRRQVAFFADRALDAGTLALAGV